MHQFLPDRDTAAMTSLREEEEEKSGRIAEKMEKIVDGIETCERRRRPWCWKAMSF